MLTDEQLAERRKGITATDVAKIVGQSPYGCAEDVRLDKMGAGLPFVEHDRVKWGNLLEDPIRRDYADRRGMVVQSGDEIGTLRHPREPWALATPDSLVFSAPSWHVGTPLWGHEVKTHTSWLSHLYGEPGTDQVPGWELIQCAWNIWVCSAFYGAELDRWDLTVFLDGLPTDYTIMRDPELEAALITSCRMFWETHVQGGEPVPPDGSEHYGEILKAKWPKHREGSLEATEDQEKLIAELRDTRIARKGWETEEGRLVQEIKLIMGDMATLEWLEEISGKEKTQKIGWKRSKDSERVDYKSAFMELASYLPGAVDIDPENFHRDVEALILGHNPDDIIIAVETIKARHTSTKPGSRRFTVPRNWSTK